ncbi:MAG: hypothetical protein M1817_003802 [Caeruleum heppii]|nr:MAG: hypothetical protein M1817_003802 [Caeruleum heppii]
MFYSHEILTSRKYGVATVWLVATLGPKSTLRKVNRKAILEVNVPKACETILMPEAPMALRLQSNLLYGVSRVYSQQCGYVLTDAQNAQTNIRALLKIVKATELDPDAGKARPEQLVLPDDPAFLPDIPWPTIDLDFSTLDLSSASSHQSSDLSPYSRRSSQTSGRIDDVSQLGLVIPTSETGVGDIDRLILPGEDFGRVRRESRLDIDGPVVEDEGDGYLPDVDFEFDAEGNVRDIGTDERADDRAAPDILTTTRFSRDSGASGRVRREHAEGLRARLEEQPLEQQYDMTVGDDYHLLAEAEPFPERVPVVGASPTPLEEESLESGGALLQRHRKAPRAMEMDEVIELRNTDLNLWSEHYVANMTVSARAKTKKKVSRQAKKNAAVWVYEGGIGGVGAGLGSAHIPFPLQMFSGAALLQALRPEMTPTSPQKRPRGEEGEAEDGRERRLRPRSEDGHQIGRGGDTLMDDDGLVLPGDDDGFEVGREAPPSLQDISSTMPWNITTSIHGSRQGSSAQTGRGFLSSGLGPALSSSIGRPGAYLGPSETGSLPPRRASRQISASPLFGRGRPSGLERFSSLELPEGEEEEINLLGPPISEDREALEEFQLFGPAAGVDTQTAAQTQFIKETLDWESGNFLDFIRTGIAARQEGASNLEEAVGRASVSFEELLLPAENSKMVAAQGFVHTLLLATKNLILVRQDEDYGEIRMTPVGGV